jgi:hypothetical protein
LATSVLASVAFIALAVFLVLGGPAVVLLPLMLVALGLATLALLRAFGRERFQRQTGAPSSAEASYEPVQEPRSQ